MLAHAFPHRESIAPFNFLFRDSLTLAFFVASQGFIPPQEEGGARQGVQDSCQGGAQEGKT